MDAPFPTWRDLGLSKILPSFLKKLEYGETLNFLVYDRIYLIRNTVLYTYLCGGCGYHKYNQAISANYNECSHCSSTNLSVLPHWEMNRKTAPGFSNLLDICLMMEEYHFKYCGIWHKDTFTMRVDVEKIMFSAKFYGGEEAFAECPVLAGTKAALCCPFMWDERFSFKEGKFKDRPSNLQISHLIYQWMENGKSSK
jgi:hypothetical protein